ncbi:MAG: hypothetical protein M1840_005079 [Geoglossum simile]|nr:MAG: hypothetical protein M1840_005079 [Geoglossum simile]
MAPDGLPRPRRGYVSQHEFDGLTSWRSATISDVLSIRIAPEYPDSDISVPGATFLQMAQENVSNPLHDTRMITWSPLPSVRYTEGYSTENESTSGFKMAEEQLADWKNFETEVREMLMPLWVHKHKSFLLRRRESLFMWETSTD